MKCKYLLLSVVFIICLSACKKESKSANQNVTIVGKWFIIRQSSFLFYNGTQIDSFSKNNFTSSDFVEYYSDGTGYFSQAGSNGPSIIEFTYTLKDSTLTQHDGTNAQNLIETIRGLTANNLSIHAQSTIPDPNNGAQLDTEIDDLSYSRQR